MYKQTMNKKKILFLGYSSFLQRRVLPAVKKFKNLQISICSKSSKINTNLLITENNYIEAIKKKPYLVYISLVNNMHFKYALLSLQNNCHVIVDKPITNNFIKTKYLVNLAKKKKLLLAEATLFDNHRIFNYINKLITNKNKLIHIQSNFNIPRHKNIKILKKIEGDCLADMSPYAAAIIRIYMKRKVKKIYIEKERFKKTNLIRNFNILCKSANLSYFGNFGVGSEYINQIIFYTKNKIIYLDDRAFAIPPKINIQLKIKYKDKFYFYKIKKDDCIFNYIKDILINLKSNKLKIYYEKILFDAKMREYFKKS